MEENVCPWWLGYLLASPIRRLTHHPRTILSPYVREGMTVLDAGPGMGYFSLPLARMAGTSGRVVCVDLQDRMLASLRRRAERAKLADRMEFRPCGPDSLGITDLAGRCDFALAFWMVHEVPDQERFLREVFNALKAGGTLLVSEPAVHVTASDFDETLSAAHRAGFDIRSRTTIRHSHSVILSKP